MPPLDISAPYGLANILFSGPCNQRCPHCIGQHIEAQLQPPNLSAWPLQNLDRFVQVIRRTGTEQIIFTGTNTDPQLYRYEERLIHWLRAQLAHVKISLHTNAQLALAKLDVLNLYDRATISFPSFDTETFYRMTRARSMPNLETILARATIPIKISCLIDRHNLEQIPSLIEHCRDLGIRRLALRRQVGPTPRPEWEPPEDCQPVAHYQNNPVYNLGGIQVTYWRFETTTVRSLNLFADGTLNDRYLLASQHRRHLPKPGT